MGDVVDLYVVFRQLHKIMLVSEPGTNYNVEIAQMAPFTHVYISIYLRILNERHQIN